MDHSDMTIEEFEDLTFAHGANLAAWPEGARTRAEGLLATDPEARAVLDRARAVDASLTLARPANPEPSAALISRILADAAAQAYKKAPAARIAAKDDVSILDRIHAFLSPAAACAASAALGLWLGYAGPVDFTGVAADALGVEAGVEFALLDGIGASPMDGVFDVMEGSE